MLDHVQGLKKGAKKITKGGVGDLSDWLHTGTSLLLCLFAAAYFSRGFVADPISCFPPAHWPHSWVSSANASCYNGFLYAHSFDGYHPLPPESMMKARQVSFHQFAMWVALGQAALYLVPGLIWKKAYQQNRKSVK